MLTEILLTMKFTRFLFLLSFCLSLFFIQAQPAQKDTVYVFCKTLDKGYNSIKVNFNTQGVTDKEEIPDIYFVVDTTSTNSILTIYRPKSYLRRKMVKIDSFKNMTVWDISSFFRKYHVYMVLEKELNNETVKCFEIGPAILGIE